MNATAAQTKSLEWLNRLRANPKIPLIVAGSAAVAVMVALILWAKAPDYRTLFSNLSDQDGGAIVSQLTQMNIPYRFSEASGAIEVPADKVHELRLRLAQQGLPKGGAVGFELLDQEKVDGLDFAIQYQGKNSNRSTKKQNGDGYALSVDYNINGFGIVGAYSKSDRTNDQVADGNGSNAELWSLAAKYDANNVYAAVMYGETRNMTPGSIDTGVADQEGNTIMRDQLINETQNFEAVVQYQFDFGLRPSLGYVYSKGKDIKGVPGHRYVDADRVNYIEVGTWYYFNKNMNVYTAYKFNMLDKDDAAITGAAADDQFAVGIVYQF